MLRHIIQKEHWLSELEKCDWAPGQCLYLLLKENELKQVIGQAGLVPMLVDGDRLISFCTFGMSDYIKSKGISPWISFVYTFPEYRGHHYSGMLLDYVESIATVMEREYVYISTQTTGLYEKYGYEFYMNEIDIGDEDASIYRKNLSEDGDDKKRRYERGAKWKAEIVKLAKKNINEIAYCGLSCNQCFMGEWCGGCRSTFNCCSFGTLFELGKCPNMLCCEEKQIEGCYLCEQLENCSKGFYGLDEDGAKESKEQAISIKKDKYYIL